MRVFFVGDICGSSGREALKTYITQVFQSLAPDVVVVNGENAAHGLGITAHIVKDFFSIGVDVITLGNHAFDKNEIMSFIDGEPRLIRPANFPAGTVGAGAYVHTLPDGTRFAVVNLMGRLFMDALDDPFACIDALLPSLDTKCVLVDFHAEATSEKQTMAHFLDGRVSAVLGTHTHVPTADARILSGGTAAMSDVGMTGDYAGIIGVKTAAPLENFTRRTRTVRMQPADGPGTLCGVMIDIDAKTGHATAIKPVRLGPHLENTPL